LIKASIRSFNAPFNASPGFVLRLIGFAQGQFDSFGLVCEFQAETAREVLKHGIGQAGFVQRLDKYAPVFVTSDDILFAITTANNMVNRPFVFYSGFTRHYSKKGRPNSGSDK
jgi:hypothetical protein